MVYGVFGGEYSDWELIGYFNNREDADKYCALHNSHNFYSPDYYVREMTNLQNEEDLSNVSLKYEYKIRFIKQDNGKWVLFDEPYYYSCYIADKLGINRIKLFVSEVLFNIHITENNRKLAEKIAQDYLYKLLAYSDDNTISEEIIDLMNEQFKEQRQ